MTLANSCGEGHSAGTRMFRWDEPRNPLLPDLYYKVWYYFPEKYTLTGDLAWRFWNILVWKSKTPTQNDAFYQINIDNRPDPKTGNLTGNMYLVLSNWQCLTPQREFCGPAGSSAEEQLRPRRVLGAETLDVPVDRWFYIEAFYKSAGGPTGHVMVWQDGTLLWDVPNVQTRYADGETQWSVDSYSTGLDPQPAHIVIDNASISR